MVYKIAVFYADWKSQFEFYGKNPEDAKRNAIENVLPRSLAYEKIEVEESKRTSA